MNETYRCIVVDDDEIDRLTTVSFLKQHPAFLISGVYASAGEALEAISHAPPDVAFLDIDMPGISGLELRQQLMNIPVCIFITAYAEYAVDSFDAAALDFIVKPLKADRFNKAAHRAIEYLGMRKKVALLDVMIGGDTIFIKDGHEQVKLSLHEVVYLEALKDYTSIVTPSRKYCVLGALGNLLKERAFHQFIRIHRSYAVQKHYISKIGNSEIEVHNGTLPVGRTYKKSLDELKA